jgi:hypothetical protein
VVSIRASATPRCAQSRGAVGGRNYKAARARIARTHVLQALRSQAVPARRYVRCCEAGMNPVIRSAWAAMVQTCLSLAPAREGASDGPKRRLWLCHARSERVWKCGCFSVRTRHDNWGTDAARRGLRGAHNNARAQRSLRSPPACGDCSGAPAWLRMGGLRIG